VLGTKADKNSSVGQIQPAAARGWPRERLIHLQITQCACKLLILLDIQPSRPIGADEPHIFSRRECVWGIRSLTAEDLLAHLAGRRDDPGRSSTKCVDHCCGCYCLRDGALEHGVNDAPGNLDALWREAFCLRNPHSNSTFQEPMALRIHRNKVG